MTDKGAIAQLQGMIEFDVYSLYEYGERKNNG